MIKKLYPIKLYLKKRPIWIMLALALILNIFGWVWLLWNIRPQEELVFLHYNILFGVDLIGEWWKILYLPITGLFIIIVNTLLGWLVFARDRYVSMVFLAVAVLCQVLIVVATLLLVFLNV